MEVEALNAWKFKSVFTDNKVNVQKWVESPKIIWSPKWRFQNFRNTTSVRKPHSVVLGDQIMNQKCYRNRCVMNRKNPLRMRNKPHDKICLKSVLSKISKVSDISERKQERLCQAKERKSTSTKNVLAPCPRVGLGIFVYWNLESVLKKTTFFSHFLSRQVGNLFIFSPVKKFA